MKDNYTVYVHTLPNGKMYVGYLNLNSDFFDGMSFEEIMDSGNYHENRTSLSADIQNYGWDQVKTEAISGLTKDQAIEKKKQLCSEYQSYLPEFGYNRYADAGLKQPPKIDRTPMGKLAKKLISTFLHGDFTIYDFLLEQLSSYTDEGIATLFDTIRDAAGFIALSLTRKKFDNLYAEASYLLKVLDEPNCVTTRYVP